MRKGLGRKLGLAMVLFGFAAVTVHSVEARRQAETPLPQLPYLSTHFGCLADNAATDDDFAQAANHIDAAVAFVRAEPGHSGHLNGELLWCARHYVLLHHSEKATALLAPYLRAGGEEGKYARQELAFDRWLFQAWQFQVPSKSLRPYFKKENKCQ